MPASRLIGIIAVVTWLMVGLPALLYHATTGHSDWRWLGVFAAFGALFALDLRRPHLLLLATAAAAALSLVPLRCNGYEGALLALIAMQLGTRVTPAAGIAWILAQTALLGVADALQFSSRSAWLLVPPYLGFQLVAFFVFHAMRRETAARAALAASNAELRAVGQILADSGRMAERLRIAQELHDALGHHLTALSLNLEAALQLTQGAAHASVATAQGLARRLLNDVREIVAASRSRDGINLAEALQALVERGAPAAHPSRHPRRAEHSRSGARTHPAALRAGDDHQCGAPRQRRQPVDPRALRRRGHPHRSP